MFIIYKMSYEHDNTKRHHQSLCSIGDNQYIKTYNMGDNQFVICDQYCADPTRNPSDHGEYKQGSCKAEGYDTRIYETVGHGANFIDMFEDNEKGTTQSNMLTKIINLPDSRAFLVNQQERRMSSVVPVVPAVQEVVPVRVVDKQVSENSDQRCFKISTMNYINSEPGKTYCFDEGNSIWDSLK